MEKLRLDLFLLERKLASTRTKAQELIRGGHVRVDGQICEQPGTKISEDQSVELLAEEHPYVSRGGVKLAGALERFQIAVNGLAALDVGQSTGGFTQCLLQRGASRVVGVEVGHGQLAAALRDDPRVTCLEHQDIRKLDLAETFPVCVVDLSFISLTLVLPHLVSQLSPGAHLILLVKPQFEVGPEKLGSGGIVRKPEDQESALRKVERSCIELGLTVAGEMESPVKGGDGNREYLLYLRGASS